MSFYIQLPSGFWVRDDGSGPYFRDVASGDTIPISGTWVVGVPATPTSPGEPGQLARDDDYIYVCIEMNTWRRLQIGAW